MLPAGCLQGFLASMTLCASAVNIVSRLSGLLSGLRPECVRFPVRSVSVRSGLFKKPDNRTFRTGRSAGPCKPVHYADGSLLDE